MKRRMLGWQQYGFVVAVFGVVLLGVWGVAGAEKSLPELSVGDVLQEGTPIQVQLPTGTDTPEPPDATVTRTPTSLGPALIEANGVDTNVRAGPDITDNLVGRIQPGERYQAISRRFEWIRIEYPNSPTRDGWVHQSVVTVIGDGIIPEISEDQLPTIDATVASQRETEIAITLTPGGIITLTAQAFITPAGLFTTSPNLPTNTLAPGERLPTFTYPPFTNTPIPVQELQVRRNVSQTQSDGFAPAIPILGLIGLGLFGLFVGIFRRL